MTLEPWKNLFDYVEMISERAKEAEEYDLPLETAPGPILELCKAFEEAVELADKCDKVFSLVESIGRDTFCHADFYPEHKKTRAFLEKWGKK